MKERCWHAGGPRSRPRLTLTATAPLSGSSHAVHPAAPTSLSLVLLPLHASLAACSCHARHCVRLPCCLAPNASTGRRTLTLLVSHYALRCTPVDVYVARRFSWTTGDRDSVRRRLPRAHKRTVFYHRQSKRLLQLSTTTHSSTALPSPELRTRHCRRRSASFSLLLIPHLLSAIHFASAMGPTR